MQELMRRGEEVNQIIQVAREEGTSMDDFIIFQKSLFFDMTYLQQDVYNEVDNRCPIDRQHQTFALIGDLIAGDYPFATLDQARDFFLRLRRLFKNLNYVQLNSPAYRSLYHQIERIALEAASSSN